MVIIVQRYIATCIYMGFDISLVHRIFLQNGARLVLVATVITGINENQITSRGFWITHMRTDCVCFEIWLVAIHKLSFSVWIWLDTTIRYAEGIVLNTKNSRWRVAQSTRQLVAWENLKFRGLTNKYVKTLHKLPRAHPSAFAGNNHDLDRTNVLIIA